MKTGYGCIRSRIHERFLDPESYSGILIAMSRGMQRVSDIASFAGYSNKKCGIYLQALYNAGIIGKKKEFSEDRRSTSRYYLRSGYMSFWVRFIMTPQADLLAGPGNDEHIYEYIDNVLVPDQFRRLCMWWFGDHEYEYDMPGYSLIPEYYGAGNLGFDYIYGSGKKKIFIKIWADLGGHYGAGDFEKLEKESVKLNPFYENIYCLFSIHRFSDSMWNISKQYDNVHLIEARFLS